MTITVPTGDEKQLRNAAALCVLLARHDLSDICAWTLLNDRIEGQLSHHRDADAQDRIHELASHLDDAQVITEPGHYRDRAYTRVEAFGTADGAPVRFWAHIGHHPREVPPQ